MKKHMYLRILWPYLVGICVFIFFSIKGGNIFEGLEVGLFLATWVIMTVPFILSIIFLVKDYRNCSRSQKVVCVSLNSLVFISIVLSGIVYYNFITTFKFPMM